MTSPEIQHLATEAEGFAGRWFKNNTSKSLLVMAGCSGTGKTHVLNALYRFARKAAWSAFEMRETHRTGWRKIPSTAFFRWTEAVAELKAGSRGFIQDAVEADFLCIDDIGAEDDPWHNGTSALCLILSRRENKFTAITTNVESAAWGERFDVRIADRFLRNSVVVDLSKVNSYALGGGDTTPPDIEQTRLPYRD